MLDQIRAALEAWLPFRGEILNYRKDGTTYWNEVQIVPVSNEQGWFTHWISVHRDVTERKNLEAQILQLAYHDPLTALPNRRLLTDRLQHAMVASARSQEYGAVIFLDLDHFKTLNDTHGHNIGDSLLIEVSHRIAHCVRAADTVSRFGGDEFVVLLNRLDTDKAKSLAQSTLIAEKIRLALAKPYALEIHASAPSQTIMHECTSSIGVVLFIEHQVCLETILKFADAAMYAAKKAGRNQIRFHS